jgi:hypothetical protein
VVVVVDQIVPPVPVQQGGLVDQEAVLAYITEELAEPVLLDKVVLAEPMAVITL